MLYIAELQTSLFRICYLMFYKFTRSTRLCQNYQLYITRAETGYFRRLQDLQYTARMHGMIYIHLLRVNQL